MMGDGGAAKGAAFGTLQAAWQGTLERCGFGGLRENWWVDKMGPGKRRKNGLLVLQKHRFFAGLSLALGARSMRGTGPCGRKEGSG